MLFFPTWHSLSIWWRIAAASVAALAVVVAIVVVLVQRNPPDTLHLALIVPLQTPSGMAIVDGVRLAVEDVNRDGGIGGRRLEVLTFDDEDDPAVARSLAQQVADDERVVAVLGHQTSTLSIAAGEVYEARGVPAISGSATATSVTEGNDWYFRTIYDNQRQATFMAHYLGEVLNVGRVAVLSGRDEFGRDLTRSFLDVVSTYEDMEVTVVGDAESGLGGSEDIDEESLSSFIADIPDGTQAIYFATFAPEAAWVISRLREQGREYVYVGSDALAEPDFLELAGDAAEGVYVPSAVIFDAGNERTLGFYRRFVERNEYEPGAYAATFYDAAVLTARALQRVLSTTPEGETPSTAELRALLRQDLAEQQTERAHIHHGVTSDILFDDEGNALAEIEVGVYQGQRLLSAPVQLRVDGPLQNGDFVFTRTDVVFVGIDLASLTNVDAERGVFEGEFLLSFRQRSGADGANILFTNEGEPIDIGRPLLVQEADGVRTEVHRFKGTFISHFDFSKFPFDTQTLNVTFIHAGLGTGALQYAIEEPIIGNAGLEGDFGTSGEWRLKGLGVATTANNIGRGLGSLSVLADDSFERSGLEAKLTLERDVISAAFKNLFPIFVVIVMLYTTLFLPVTARQERLTVAVSSLLAVAFFSTGVSNVARPGHLIGMDYFFLTAYALAFTNLGLTVLLNMDRFEAWAPRANRTVVVLYPIAVALASSSFFF